MIYPTSAPSPPTCRVAYSADGIEWHNTPVVAPLWRRVLSRILPFVGAGGDSYIRFRFDGNWFDSTFKFIAVSDDDVETVRVQEEELYERNRATGEFRRVKA